MSIQFILGASGSGKSNYIYNNIIEESLANPDRNYFIIVPEQYTMSVQREIILRHPGHAIMNIDIISFQRMAYRIFAELGVNILEVLDDTGKNLILKKIIEDKKEELEFLKKNANKVGFVNEVKSVISELLQYSITPDMLKELSGSFGSSPILEYKLKDIELLYRSFNEYISDKYIASEELLEVLNNHIRDSKLVKDSVIYIDGFTGFTPIQYKLIATMLEICNRVSVTITIDTAEKINVIDKDDNLVNLFFMGKTVYSKLGRIADEKRITVESSILMEDKEVYRLKDNKELCFLEKNLFRNNKSRFVLEDATKELTGDRAINLYEGTNPKNEVEYTVGKIKELIKTKGYHYSDIAVVCADMDTYGFLAGNIMEQNDIPCFVDNKRDITSNLFVEAIRSALDVVDTDFSYEAVFRFLKTGLSGVTDEDIDVIENYILALGIKGYSRWHKMFSRKLISHYEKQPSLDRINGVRAKVVGIFEGFRTEIRKCRTVREYCVAVYNLIEQLDLYNKTMEYSEKFEKKGMLSLSIEYRQCYRLIMELLDKLVILLGDENISYREFTDILDAGFSNIKVGIIPASRDSIIIGDIERSRIDNIKVLFVLGLNDGNVPKKSENTGILSVVDREELAENNITLSPSDRENAAILRYYLYLILTKASEKLYLSYAKTSLDGKAIKESYIVGNIMRMFPDLVKKSNADEKLLMKSVKIPKALITWKAFEGAGIKADNAKETFGEELVQSISRIEKFYQCPFAYFLSYGMMLEERRLYKINAMDIGNIYHNTLELVSKAIIEAGYKFSTIEEDKLEEIINQAVLDATMDYNNSILNDSNRSRYFVDKLNSMIKTTVWAIRAQLGQGKFEPKRFEKVFKTKNNVVGRIDRIDTYETDDKVYVKVVDYKTGENEFELEDAYYGLKIQLVTYMKAALELEKQENTGKEVVMSGMYYYNIQEAFASDDAAKEDINKERLESLVMKGVTNSDPEVIDLLEKDKEGKSIAIPVSFVKSGQIRKNKNALDVEHFELLSNHVEEKIKDANERIKNGKVNITPYKKGDNDGCEYCPYAAVCGFDLKLGYSYNSMESLDNEALWNKMAEENGSKSKTNNDAQTDGNSGKGEE